MKLPSCWDFIELGEFSAACEAAEREATQFKSFRRLGNKVIALLNLGEFDEAVKLSVRLGKLSKGEVGGYYIKEGVALWLMNQPAAAIEVWKKERTAKYTDAAGGLTPYMLLLFAAISLQDDALKKEALSNIAEIAREQRAFNWPGALGKYLIGELTEDEIATGLSAQPTIRRRQLCAVNFHVGAEYLHTNPDQFIKHMSLATEGPPAILLEPQFYLAKGELVKKGLAKWGVR